MKAVLVEQPGATDPAERMQLRDVPRPSPLADQVLIEVLACGVCRTDLHVVDGDLENPLAGVIPGHEIIGTVAATGSDVTKWAVGDRVGVPWLAHTCGVCTYCSRDQENLCDRASFHGYTVNGGYAEFTVAHQDYCVAIPEQLYAQQATPLLCAGLIGYRGYRMTQLDRVQRLGLYGFGAAGHLLAQLAVHDGREVFAFTREGDTRRQRFALELGCAWSGASTVRPPRKLDAAIVFAPVGSLMVEALKSVDKGGRVVSAGIHMSPIPQFDYDLLWGERSVTSVANLQRRDAEEYIPRALAAGVRPRVTRYPLAEAPRALDDLRAGRVEGAAVLVN